MTTSPTTEGTAVRRAEIPIPRAAGDDVVVPEPAEAPTADHAAEHDLPAAQFPWPEPWRSSRGARPRSEFWDVATASWHSRGPYPR